MDSSESQDKIIKIQRMLYYYTRWEYDRVAAILQGDPLLRTFQKIDQRCKKCAPESNQNQDDILFSLQQILSELPDTAVIQWLLSFEEVDINCVFDILKPNGKPQGSTITALEQMLINKFSMDSVMMFVKDERFTKASLNRASLSKTTPIVTFFAGGFHSIEVNAFIHYVTNNIESENPETFLREYLSLLDINAQSERSGDPWVKDEGKTLLMMALSEFTEESKSKPLVKLIDLLLSDPKLDPNVVDEEGWSAMYYLANCSSENLEAKIHMIQALFERDDINVNICTKNGKNLITFFIDRFFWVLNQSVEQQAQIAQSRYSNAPKILEQLVARHEFSDPTQASCLLYFLEHPVFTNLEPKKSTNWYDTYRTRLAEACIGIIRLLMNFKALDINKQSTKNGYTAMMMITNLSLPVHTFMRNELVKLFLEHSRLNINQPDNEGITAHVHAIRNGQAQTMMQILESNNQCDLNTRDKSGLSALSHALELPPGDNRREIVTLLATQSGLENLNLQDDTGKTAIHVLLENERFESVLKILKTKRESVSDPLLLNLEDKQGQTAFDILVNVFKSTQIEEKKTELESIFTAMLELPNVNINGILRHKRTLLHLCILEEVNTFVAVLLKHQDVDVNAQDDSGFTPLMYAVTKSNLDVVSMLLMNSLCDLTLKSKQDEDVLDLVRKADVSNEHVRTLINVVYHRTTNTNAKSVMSNIGIEDQLRFLMNSVEKDAHMHQQLKDDIISQLTGIQSDIAVNAGGRFGADFRMSDEHRRKLIGLRAYLCDEMIPRDLFCHLVADNILTDNLVEEIEQEQTRRRMCEKLLSVLPLRGKNAFQSFINALEQEGQSHVAEAILHFDPNAEKHNPEREKQMENGSISGSMMEPYFDQNEPYAVIPLRFMMAPYNGFPPRSYDHVFSPRANNAMSRSTPKVSRELPTRSNPSQRKHIPSLSNPVHKRGGDPDETKVKEIDKGSGECSMDETNVKHIDNDETAYKPLMSKPSTTQERQSVSWLVDEVDSTVRADVNTSTKP